MRCHVFFMATSCIYLFICVLYNIYLSLGPWTYFKISLFPPSLSLIVMPPALCLLLHFGVTSVWNLHHRRFQEKKKRRLRITSGASCCDEVFLRNAKLRSFNELTYQAGEESNLMQLFTSRGYTNKSHNILNGVPLSTDCKQCNPIIMFAELLSLVTLNS